MKKINLLLWLLLICSIFLLCICQEKNKKIYQEPENINLAIYLENEQTATIPSKDSGYYFDKEKSSCTNDAYINWDSVSWSPVIKNAHNYPVRCELHFATIYNEGILNGTDPILKDELIPVEIEDDGTVRKADLTKPWYSYAEQKWANAVITQNSYDALKNSGDVHGATKNDGYVSFDGVDDYIDLGLENYDFGNEVTIAITFSVNKVNSENYSRLIGNWEAAGVGLHVLSNQKVRIDVHNGTEYVYVDSKNTINLGENNTVIGSYDGQTIKLYLNGVLVASLNSSFAIAPSNKPFFLGANPNNSTHTDYANVNISEALIYNRALSEEEISTLSAGTISNSQGLLTFIDFADKKYETDEVIPESVIESYFVWIPKYRYQLWDLGMYNSLTSIDTNKVHEIPIIFGDYNTSDSVEGECATPMESGTSGNCNIGDYMTHPAFLSIPSKGFWVGKFETGYDGATIKDEAEKNERDSSKIIVKPNTYSWRYIQVANAFYNSYDYKRNLDSHMMKNTEWGATVYLSHSKYGLNGEIRENNNVNLVTGYASTSPQTCHYTASNDSCNPVESVSPSLNGQHTMPYNTTTGYLASTTGNISGVYDLSGGAWEYVMSFMLNDKGKILVGNKGTEHSGFSGILANTGETIENLAMPDAKYYDKYLLSSSTTTDYQNRILGDATSELGPFFEILNTPMTTLQSSASWYEDKSLFLGTFTSYGIIFLRGGIFYNWLSIGKQAGMFAFTNGAGEPNQDRGYRIILTP